MPSTVFKGKNYFIWGFPGGSVIENLPAKQETRSGRYPGGRHGNPLQYSCLGNPMDRGAWKAI